MRSARHAVGLVVLLPLLLAAPTTPATAAAPRPAALENIPTAFPVVNGSYVPVAGNFDCDEGDDGFGSQEPGIIWYARGSAPDYLWTDLAISGGVLSKSQATLSITGTYTPIVGDFDTDGCDDIFWYGVGSAHDYLWWGGPTGFTNGVSVNVSGSYRPVAIANRIVWYSPLGTESMWEGTGVRSAPFAVRAFPQVSGTGYQPVAFPDAGTGAIEILWYTPGAGADSIWDIPDLAAPSDHTVLPVSISGTYLTTTHLTDVVLHGPGSAPDQLMAVVNGQVTFSTLAIDGTYVVGGKGRVLVWHGPGTAPDQVWLTPPAPTTAVETGWIHTCALGADGAVRCWGWNGEGELGLGTMVRANQLTPGDPVSGLTGAVAMVAGGFHSCALLTSGRVDCWGYNRDGELGDGTTVDRSVPVEVQGLTGVTDVSAGVRHTCAVTGGQVECWGDNTYGELGDGTTTSRSTPEIVVGLSDAIAVSTGQFHSCALVTGGQVKCWGDNTFGDLGDGTTTDSAVPVTVLGLTGVTAIGVSCALLAGGEVSCWGYNGNGDLGDGTTTDRSTPVQVLGLAGVTAISRTCALMAGGSVRCWGRNTYGQVGDGSTVNRTTPVAVSGLAGAIGISSDGTGVCAVVIDGPPLCWGINSHGEVGDGTTIDRWTPVPVVGL